MTDSTPATTMTLAVTLAPQATSGTLPTHPTILAFWIQYFADRLRAVLEDAALSASDRQQWLNEFPDDLADLAQQGSLDPVTCQHAHALAVAQQAFIFHDGPDPETDPTLKAQTTPHWDALLPPQPSPTEARAQDVYQRVLNFFVQNHVTCTETISQCDWVIENAYDFLTDLFTAVQSDLPVPSDEYE